MEFVALPSQRALRWVPLASRARACFAQGGAGALHASAFARGAIYSVGQYRYIDMRLVRRWAMDYCSEVDSR